jgi:hypothetical protein
MKVKQLLSVVSEVAPSVSSKNVKEVFRIYKEDTIARELAAKLASSDRTGAVDLMAEYQQLFEVSDIEKEPELADLVAERFNKEGLMPILPMALNEALDGGARKEHHLLVFGRPESGKSLVSINIACGLAKFGARGIFFENEDRTDDTRLRFWCNLSGMDKHQIRENPRRAQEIATSNGIRNLRVQPLSPGTPGEIKYFVKSVCLLISAGVRCARASNGVIPNGSEILGITKRLPTRKASRHCLPVPFRCPVKIIFPDSPSSADCSISSRYCSPGPTMSSRLFGRWATTFWKACSKWVSPFWMVRRPALTTTP